MRKLALWCFRHRVIVFAVWLVGAIVLSAVHGSVGSDYKDTFNLKQSDSTEAINLIKSAAPKQSGDSDQIVFAVSSGSVKDAAVRDRIEPMLKKVSTIPHVGSVTSPYGPAGAAQISKSGKVAYATVTFDELGSVIPKHNVTDVIDTAQAAATKTLSVNLGGNAIEQAAPRGAGGTGEGILAALVVLLIVFGSVWAALLPLLAAGFALGTGVAVIGLLSNAITMASFSEQLALLIGLGVGVDYALFIVTRFRQALLRGKSGEEAIMQSLDTSGRAVLFAGVTVCIALLGMFALGVSFLYGVAIAASLVVAFTVLAALTLLPALIGFFSVPLPRFFAWLAPKIAKVLPGPIARWVVRQYGGGLSLLLTGKQRRAVAAGALTTSDESKGWSAWAGRLQSRPLIAALAAAVVMIVIAAPALSMRLGSSDAGSDTKESTTRKAYDQLATGFGPGFNGPLQLVAEVKQPRELAQFKEVVAAVAKDPDVVAATPPRVIGKGVAISQVVPKGSPQDKSTTDLVNRLRNTTVPGAEQGHVDVKVGGQTAIFIDFAKTLSSKLPLFIGVVVILSFLLLMAVFRSLLIPLMAAVMNLLSVAAAFGVVTAVFQHGIAADLIGVSRTGPIEAFVPVMVFAILFGLSMDYEVFLMSRIYEEWHRRGDNKEAIVHGLAATGRTITAAAAIMVLVFAAFILGGERIIKLFGLGLASAVLLDAIVVRSILIPGLMLVIGERNWWLPGWLDRVIPHLNVEGELEELSVGGGATATATAKPTVAPPAPR